MKKRFFAAMMALTLLLTGCQEAQDKDKTITPAVTEEAGAVTEFGLTLLKELNAGNDNTMISPVSILSALAMTANGAKGDTLAQMEAAFGLSMDKMNPYFGEVVKNLPSSSKSKLNVANSIWIDSSLNVLDEFIDINKQYYDAKIERASLSGADKQINRWVQQQTDGMIKDIVAPGGLSGVSMALINAVAFDAKWEEKYEHKDVKDETFTTGSGTKETVDMMFSEENIYLSDDNAVGFMKYYKGKDYAFVALLPDEDISLSSYLKTLTGEKLQELLTSAENLSVKAGLPKFTESYSAKLNEHLKKMGIKDAFDVADFSGITGRTDLQISEVLHKTYIEVDENGTKAAAATQVNMTSSYRPDSRIVYLTRPFLYLIVDCEQLLPIFIGTIVDP